MATIGITGMGGFIGFHLAKKLHGEGHDVVGFDSFNNYYDPMLKSNRASNLHEKTGITTQNVDLKNREELDHWMKKKISRSYYTPCRVCRCKKLYGLSRGLHSK